MMEILSETIEGRRPKDDLFKYAKQTITYCQLKFLCVVKLSIKKNIYLEDEIP